MTILTLDDRYKNLDDRDIHVAGLGSVGGTEDESDNSAPIDYRINENKEKNKTGEYDQNDLIVRRACSFDIGATFSRELNSTGDTVILELRTGKQPSLKSGTLIRIEANLSGNIDNEDVWCMAGDWSFMSESKVTLTVNVPPKACLGKYSVRLYLRTRTQDEKINSSFQDLAPLYVVANPFTSRDTCWNSESKPGFFSGTSEFIEEHIINENGAVWQSSSRGPHPKPWIFGQFEEDVLEVACHLIANDRRTETMSGGAKLSDLVQISRILSAKTNCNQDDGVLVGKWSGDYTEGTKPWQWMSSVSILKEYKQNGYKPVKYGQCWVFSGVLVTLLRTLGIPARSVTNYSSAHDTDNTMTIDTYYNDDNQEVNLEGVSDSVWNFHVWNECWLNRPDLPEGYDGWQALDATPQELSEDRSQCGPAPIKAIKEGKTFINYDVAFLYAEVNADSCSWRVDRNNKIIELTSRDRAKVGQNISTTVPGVGCFDRLDITDSYKYIYDNDADASNFERAFAYTANRSDMQKHLFATHGQDIVQIGVRYKNEIKFGIDLELEMFVKNISTSTLTAKNAKVTLNSTYQRGEVHNYIMQFNFDEFELNPSEGTV